MNESQQANKFFSITGFELQEGETYWYPSVTYCCHFSQTTIHHFKFKATNPGNLQFAINEPLYRTKDEAIAIANKIRSMFGSLLR